MSLDVCKAYARLCNQFSSAGIELVIPNFADVFGFVCMAVGATGFCNGASQSTRRLCMLNYQDKGGGTPLPHLYSHRTIAEFRSEFDLDKIVNKKLLRRVRDETSYSQDLIEELDAGGSASNVPPWIESKNNTTAAKNHFIERLVIEHKRLRRSAKQRRERVGDWLETATSNMLLIEKRLQETGIKGIAAPADEWLDVLDEVLDEA